MSLSEAREMCHKMAVYKSFKQLPMKTINEADSQEEEADSQEERSQSSYSQYSNDTISITIYPFDEKLATDEFRHMVKFEPERCSIEVLKSVDPDELNIDWIEYWKEVSDRESNQLAFDIDYCSSAYD